MRMAEVHRDNGVDLRLGVTVQAIEGGERVEQVRLADGSVIPADVVVVAVGVRPATDWLEGSGLTLDDGVVCDERLVAAPGVVAAGDLARWPNQRFDTQMRDRALGERGRAGPGRRAVVAARRRRRSRSPRSRGSGATSTTPRSRWPVGRAPTPRSR